MEKLIIKNFGPVRDAELELKRINIFIGPQGSGKSTIAKILSIIRSYSSYGLASLSGMDVKFSLEREYNLAGYFEKDTNICFESKAGQKFYVDNSGYDTSIVAEASSFPSLESIYIPTERTLVPLITDSSFLFIGEKVSIAKYIREFGLLFQQARRSIKSQNFWFLDNVTYSFQNNDDRIILKDGKIISLVEGSNGIQSTLPLLLVIDFATSELSYSPVPLGLSISIEEPELSLFPMTQNELLKNILGKIRSWENYYLNITTHSPYTLTAVNNLIYAYQVGKNNPAVEGIIPRNLWLNPDDIGAWFVENGTVRSIMDIETGQIKAEEIDGISDNLNREYDRIMDIKLAQSK